MIGSFWQQVWPNLAANILWTLPVWFWHHTRIRRLLAQQAEHFAIEMHKQLGD